MLEEIDQQILSRFEIIQKVKKTNSGVVWKAIDRKKKNVVAIKKVCALQIDSKKLIKTYRESLIQLDIPNNPFMVSLNSIIKCQKNELYLVQEFVEMDLKSLIKAQILEEKHKKIILYNIILALWQIHQVGIIHCDLSPEKILITPDCQIKLLGLGLAQCLNSQNKKLNEFTKMRYYKPPEILLGANQYSNKVDVWSLGCIFGEMLNGDVVFNGSSTLNQLEKIIELTGKPEEMDQFQCEMAQSILNAIQETKKKSFMSTFMHDTEIAIDILMKMLTFLPDKRSSIEEIVKHPFLEEVYRQEDFVKQIAIDYVRLPEPNPNKFMTLQQYSELIQKRLEEKKLQEKIRFMSERVGKHSNKMSPIDQTSSPNIVSERTHMKTQIIRRESSPLKKKIRTTMKKPSQFYNDHDTISPKQ